MQQADIEEKVKLLEERLAKLEMFLEPQMKADENFKQLTEQTIDAIGKYKEVSASFLQRTLGVGYARAARLLDTLEEKGYVSKSDGTGKPRKVLKIK